jgi:DNA-directed RNA polymerase subunit RPC12/RpoP
VAKLKVNVTEIFEWECPECSTTNHSPGWLQKGDVVTCRHCKSQPTIDEQYRDCRPVKFSHSKATI